MKHTQKTDEYIDYINDAIDEINDFKDDTAGNLYLDGELIIDFLSKIKDDITLIEFEDIKSEFWDTCDNYDKILANRHIFEIKFEKLLNWKYTNNQVDILHNMRQYRYEILEFFSYQEIVDIQIEKDRKDKIINLYLEVSSYITSLKDNVYMLLEQWEKMGEPFSEPIIKKGRNAKSEPKNEIKPSGYRLASKKKTDFVKIISAMYEAKIFVNQEGKPLTNKQELMNAFGTLLNDDFSSYSTLLAQAKDGDDKKYMKIFDIIKQKGWDYLNNLNEKN